MYGYQCWAYWAFTARICSLGLPFVFLLQLHCYCTFLPLSPSSSTTVNCKLSSSATALASILCEKFKLQQWLVKCRLLVLYFSCIWETFDVGEIPVLWRKKSSMVQYSAFLPALYIAHSAGCLFAPFMVYFNAQKLFILMKSSLFFSFGFDGILLSFLFRLELSWFLNDSLVLF